MKFDVVVMNAPYNKPVHKKGRKGGYGGRTLWDKFLVKSLEEWVKEGGYVCSINPPSWRKPPNKAGIKLLDLVTKDNSLEYLNINSKKEGQRVFGASTRFDCILVKKGEGCSKNVRVIDENGDESIIEVSSLSWMPNYMFDEVSSLLAKQGEVRTKVIYDRCSYGTDKANISKEKTGAFIHPVVHSMKISGYECVYSNTDQNGHFGVSKVILSFNEKQHQPINDFDGKLAMSQIAFGIQVDSHEDGEQLVSYVKSETFQEIIKATKWGVFQTDWKMFTYFKEGFWR